jgi:formylglycine-generating enzyme required for sulfatase activity
VYVTSLTSKINQYAERLRVEEKSISNKISLYTDASVADTSYNKKIEQEREKNILIIKELQVVTLPETFTTKTGIKFTKIFKKDGKPVYVSDRIRPYEEDSWYYARDYAIKLNKENNCSDCYRLPYIEEIENLKTDNDYEGLWLQSWSPDFLGMIFGNVYLFVPWFGYTIDYIHDVGFHPLSWQSYIYPISPNSVAASRGGTWYSYGRFLRSAGRLTGGFHEGVKPKDNLGFRLVRPLRLISIEEINCTVNNKSYYKSKCFETEKELSDFKSIEYIRSLGTKHKDNWSEDFTDLNWNDAQKKCNFLGMKLPSLEQLVEAQKEGIMKDWKDGYYWSATQRSSSYQELNKNGNKDYDSPDNRRNVRCLRD